MISTDNSVLIVIDIQETVCSVVQNPEDLVKSAGTLVEGANALGLPVINFRQYPERLKDTVPQVRERLSNPIEFDKTCFSCCGSEDFNNKLKQLGVKHCIICGIEAHICVCQTVIDLIRAGYKCYVVEDATSSRKIANKVTALDRMRQWGAEIVGVEMVLFELLKSSSHPEFKKISKLIK